MFGKVKRRQLAREALRMMQDEATSSRLAAEGLLEELRKLQRIDVERGQEMRGMQQRLDDANAELRRWGLEPVIRDGAESAEHPQRYRRHSDWRTTRSGAELEELLERSLTCAPAGVDVSIEHEPEVMRTPGYMEYGKPLVGGFLSGAVARTLEDAGDRIAEAARIGPHGAPPQDCGEPPQSNDDLVAQIRLALELARDGLTTDHAYNPEAIAIEIDRALARLNPDDPMCIVSGEVHDGLAHALAGASGDVHAMRVKLHAAEEERDGLRESVEIAKAALHDAQTEARDRRESDLATLATELGWPGEEPITVNGLCLRVRDVLEHAGDVVSTRAREAEEALAAERTEREQAERSRDRAQAVNLDLQRWREKERDTLAAFVNALADAHQRGTLHIDLVAPYQRAAELLEDPDL